MLRREDWPFDGRDGRSQTVAPRTNRGQLAAKSVIDVIGAAACVVVALPVMAVVAIVVKVTSRGPVFFRHERAGRDGRTFTMLKFRTMEHGTYERILHNPELLAEYESANFKLPRQHAGITAVGRVLRRTSLDELPQLFHVLTREMSLVGLRPIELAQLRRRPRLDQELYESMRPGLTGVWQVSGRSTVDEQERLELERWHIMNWSLRLDASVMARTLSAIMRTDEAS